MALTQVSTGGIEDGQVHTADLADAQITAAKLHTNALDVTYTCLLYTSPSPRD